MPALPMERDFSHLGDHRFQFFLFLSLKGAKLIPIFKKSFLLGHEIRIFLIF